MNILFIGDIVGTPGMTAVATFLSSLVQKHRIDVVIVNGENAMDGKSISEQQLHQLFDLGVRIVTSGNHIWEKWHIHKLLVQENRLLRPANYPKENPGKGFAVVDIPDLGPIAVINLQGRTYLQTIDCPFKTADWALSRVQEEAKVILVDMHAEATAEKNALGWYLDGRVTAVVGTHTHIQTADAKVLPGGTAYITDVGMTGPYDSVVGMRKDIALKRFIRQTPHKFEMATEDVHISAVVIDADTDTGKARSIEPITFPEFRRHASDDY